jgi:hypothetical protein
LSVKLEKAAAKVISDVEERAQQKAEANEIEAEWAKNVRRHHFAKREANILEWYAFETHMYRSHAQLASEHAAKAMKLVDENPQLLKEVS